ncbi:MAG: sigma-70 family RNA polymerase sigma factor [Deltaproteobacteria bacterium]|nr:sigma-70 family RNA polymerase sigma factor [Deltaproteobacteria bacterium]
MDAAQPDIHDLYIRYGRAIYRRCQYFLQNDYEAHDAMHEVFIKVCEKYNSYKGNASLLTWVVKITTNYCLNLLRTKRAVWHDRYQQTVKVDANSRISDTDQLERREIIHTILDKLEPDIQQAAIYYYVDEMKQEEAAAACGCSEPTLRKRLQRFLMIAQRELKLIDSDIVFDNLINDEKS